MRNPTLHPKKPQSKEAKARQSLREELEKVWSMVKWTPAKGAPGRAGHRTK